ncbi:glycosyltransferase family 2 protein [Plantibacter sp. RU18]|uniref:glycosyltransferase family 2 protein n=1 Tax=Plantibacter sp. RU18 TaxID=3158143 RepID=UPI003D366DD0
MSHPDAASSAQPSIAAVVLNWRDAENTSACIASLAQDGGLDQIIIVDNEADGTLRQALDTSNAPTHVLLERSENGGFSAGVNVGLRYALDAGADFALVINNDARLHEGALSAMLAAFERDASVGIVGPAVLNEDGSLQALGPSIGFPLRINETAGSTSPDFVTWACVLVSRRLLEAAGLLDETFFMYWEDVEFGYRARAAGFAVTITPDATVAHAVSSSHSIAGDRVQLYSAYGLGRIAARQRSFLLASVIRAVLRVGKRVAARRFRFAGDIWLAYRDGLRQTEQPAYERVTKDAWPR